MAFFHNKYRAYVDRLKTIRAKLSEPAQESFWQSHSEKYRAHCEGMLVTTLMLMRPPDQTEEEWTKLVARAAATVAAQLWKDGNYTGLLIFASANNLANYEGGLEDFSRDIILKWVKAGRAGEPLGKDFTADDFYRTDDSIAFAVGWAVARGTATSTLDSLSRFMAGQTMGPLMPYLEEVLKVWRKSLASVVKEDFRLWVRGVVHARH